jgi:3-(3-hydroxy-phenyl)propionate hydroxylase
MKHEIFKDMGQVTSKLYDIAIVGCGPTGATLAALLGQAGLKVLICDRDTEIYPKPRAVAMDHEILRIFQELGISQKVLPLTEPFTDSEFYGVDGKLIKCMTSIEPPFPMIHTPSVVFNQPGLEKILRQLIYKIPSVDLMLGYELTEFSQSENGVKFKLLNHANNILGQSKYLIACDGASSFIRKSLGVEFEDLGFDEPWLVVDVLLNKSGLLKTPKVSAQYCNPMRPISYVICPKNHRRWEIAINPTDSLEDIVNENKTWELLKPWINPEDGTLWRKAAYQFHALLAKKWIKGRVILAGDAAHQQPPFLGQGMCQGIRDAKNLAWKLQAILNENAPVKLLQTYEDERKGHVRELTIRIKNIGKLVSERNISMAIKRDQQLRDEVAGVIPRIPRQDIQPHLQNGLFSRVKHPAQGSLFPQAWILDNKKDTPMDDLFGYGWRVVAEKNFQGLHKLKLSNNIPIIQVGSKKCLEKDGVLANWFIKHKAGAVLVRPDHYIYGITHNINELQLQIDELANYANAT